MSTMLTAAGSQPLLAAATYTANTDAVAGSVAWSALAGIVPLLAFFVFLMGLKWAAHWSAIGAVVVSIIVAIFAFGMPVDLTMLSLTQGVAFGIFPIIYIIWMAVWVYDLTVKSARFEDMRVSRKLPRHSQSKGQRTRRHRCGSCPGLPSGSQC